MAWRSAIFSVSGTGSSGAAGVARSAWRTPPPEWMDPRKKHPVTFRITLTHSQNGSAPTRGARRSKRRSIPFHSYATLPLRETGFPIFAISWTSSSDATSVTFQARSGKWKHCSVPLSGYDGYLGLEQHTRVMMTPTTTAIPAWGQHASLVALCVWLST